jgi:tRNA threonylcarbamoyladenosine biosynthesis protein TsaB
MELYPAVSSPPSLVTIPISAMLDLILETSLSAIRMALCDSGGELLRKHIPNGRGELLHDLLTDSLQELQSTHPSYNGLPSIHRVFVTLGPGSFTGLRTGIAYAQGLCFAGARTLYGVSTLAALKTLLQGDVVYNSAQDNILVLLAARPGMVYAGYGATLPTGFLEHEVLIPLQDVPTIWKNQKVVANFERIKGQGVECMQTILHQAPQTLNVEQDFSFQPMLGLLHTLPPLTQAKANYLQKSYAEQ